MKRLFKPVALVILFSGSWFAGMGFYHTSELPAQKEVIQDNRPAYQPFPSRRPTTVDLIQPNEKPLAQDPATLPPPIDSVIEPTQTGPADDRSNQNQPGHDTGQVMSIHDGDTISVKLDSQKVNVRLIGIDTPELVINEYGVTATEYTRKLLQGKSVKLFYDVEKYDKYGRTLAYVYLPDGTFINANLVEEGYAWVMKIQPNTAHAVEFEKLQGEAQGWQRGIWANPPPPCTWRGSKVIKTWYFNDAGSRRLSSFPAPRSCSPPLRAHFLDASFAR